DMPQRLRAEAADFKIILEERARFADFMGGGGEELPLMVIARPPRQHAADVEPFPLHLQKHVGRRDSLCRARVMSATGGMNMVIAAVESEFHRIDPALELHADGRLTLCWNDDRPLQHAVLGPATCLQRKPAGREENAPAITTINVRLKEKVGRQPAGL